MRWKVNLRLVGIIVCFIALAQLLSALVSLYYQDGMLVPFGKSIVLTAITALCLLLFFRSSNDPAMNHKQGIFLVLLGFLSAIFFGSLPYVFSPHFPYLTDCIFESVSGFTTTGASVLGDVESAPPSLLFWRSFTQWLGGMGVILLGLAVLPFLGVGGMQIFKTELPGQTSDKLRPRIRDTAKFLWVSYFSLTAAEIILLYFGDMNFFHSVCHSFGTVSTGGFSSKSGSIGDFSGAYSQLVIMLFMFLAAINFVLHFRLLKGDIKAYMFNLEFRVFTYTLLFSGLIITLFIWGNHYSSFAQSLRHSVFQTVSILSTTGFATADYQLWGALPLIVFLGCMVCGGMAGSTSGGLKILRIVLLGKLASRELKMLVHPKAVFPVKMDKKVISEEIIRGVCGFVLLYLGLIFIMTIILSSTEMDILTALGSVVACTGNIGPGLGETGAMNNYAHLSDVVKWLLSLCMFLGRLEIYVAMIFLFPAFWNQ